MYVCIWFTNNSVNIFNITSSFYYPHNNNSEVSCGREGVRPKVYSDINKHSHVKNLQPIKILEFFNIFQHTYSISDLHFNHIDKGDIIQ